VQCPLAKTALERPGGPLDLCVRRVQWVACVGTHSADRGLYSKRRNNRQLLGIPRASIRRAPARCVVVCGLSVGRTRLRSVTAVRSTSDKDPPGCRRAIERQLHGNVGVIRHRNDVAVGTHVEERRRQRSASERARHARSQTHARERHSH